MYFKLVLYLLLAAPLGAIAQKATPVPVPVIFDSDMGPDYDDAGAIALLHALADSGQATILATIASTQYPGVAGVLSVFNTYFGRPQVPVGVPGAHGLTLRDSQHWTDSLLAKYPHAIKENREVPAAAELYRKILSSQPDRSVTIVTVGFLTNLSDLLATGPDRYSPRSGAELVKQKVKRLVCMAGKFPAGKEFNVEKDAAASINVYEHWSTPIVFSGFEIGAKIITGMPIVKNERIKNSPVKDVFRISMPLAAGDSAGRKSWDETAVLVAIKGHAPWYRLREGRIKVATDGSNTWDANGKGHFYLVEDQPFETVQQMINTLMMHQPVRK